MFDWSFHLYQFRGIEVRIHWTLVAFYAITLVQAATGHYFPWAVLGLGLLWIQILCHEYGHALTAVRLGVGCDTILLWPLGGAAYCGRGRNARDDMRITAMGPTVNALFALAGAAGLVALGLWQWSLLNPFSGWRPPGFSWREIALLHTVKLGVLLVLFNLCVPAYPLDGGRLLLVWLGERFGRLGGARISTWFSFPVGIVILLWGFMGGQFFLGLLGLQVLLEAYQLRQMLAAGTADGHPAFAREPAWSARRTPRSPRAPGRPSSSHSDAARGPGWLERWRGRQREAAERRRLDERMRLRAEVDRLLDKVNLEGLGALTPDERTLLHEASRKLRSS